MRGEGRVYQRGRRCWIAYWGYRPDGQTGEVRESAGTDREQARALLKRRLREVANHREGIAKFRGPNQERVTVGDLLDSLVADYRRREIKSLRHALGHVKPVREFFGFTRALTVTTDRVRAFIAARQKEGLSNATINRETEVLGRAFRLAVEDGKLSFLPKIPALPENNARQGFFERAEFESVVKRLPPCLADLARLAYLSGWRRGELLSLTWENVDRSAGEIRIFTSKNGDGRVLPMDAAITELIERRWIAREYEVRPGQPAISAYVFHRKGKPIASTTLWKVWTASCRAAGLKGKLLHDLRRSGVRDMIRAGVSQHVAMAISGHKTASMVQRYNITTGEDKLEALRLRQHYLNSRPGVGGVRRITAAANDDTE